LLYLKTDVNVPAIRKKPEKYIFFVGILKPLKTRAGSGSILQWYGSEYPDPFENVTNPEHWRWVRYTNSWE
jgi:hypothetical protein